MKNSLKFLFFFVYLISIFWIEDFSILGLLFFLNFFGMYIFQISLKKFLSNLKILLPFLLFTIILNMILDNWIKGILMGIRLVLAYQVTYLFSKSMTTFEFADVIQNLMYPLKLFKIDPEKIGMIIRIAFCVMPILKNELEQKKYALKAKGAELKISNIIIVMKPFLISILRRTSEMEKSLKAKAYEE